MTKRRIGIVGYGKLGQHLVQAIQQRPKISAVYEVAFVWNKSRERMQGQVPPELQLASLEQFAAREPDLIVEVAHPDITRQYGPRFLDVADYMIGSPTALAYQPTETAMRAEASKPNGKGLYIPRGALPAIEEVLRMAKAGKLAQAHITMRKHPRSINYQGPTDVALAEITEETVLYDDALRVLCEYAPNNVNTMAVLATASGLGFDGVRATLVADPTLEYHITEVRLYGPERDGKRFSLEMVRSSPAATGAVTSTATLDSFLGSMLAARDEGSGVHYK